MVGSIVLLIGSMFSGKTTHGLLRISEALHGRKVPVFIVKSNRDTRYENVTTHSGQTFALDSVVISVTSLSDLTGNSECSKLFNADIECYVLIDEGHFYADTVEMVLTLRELNNHVVVTGLNGDFNQNPFECITRLLPYADVIEHRLAFCQQCNTNRAPFHKRIDHSNSPGSSNIKVGGKDVYMVLCHDCVKKCSE